MKYVFKTIKFEVRIIIQVMDKKNYIKVYLILLTLITGKNLNAQITVINPSFEDEPSDATTPHGWWGCEAETTPDIMPGYWGVYQEATEGDTYVGMITRENNTWESIGQRLSAPLLENACYVFALDLAHSHSYAGYNNPLKIRIWIGKEKCHKGQMIYESPLIDNEEWATYEIKFTPEKESQYIILEAFHKEGEVRYKGNILIDNMRSIRICGRA